MKETMSVRSFSVLLIAVVFISVIGTTLVLQSLGFLSLPTSVDAGSATVSVTVVSPDSVVGIETTGEVKVDIISEEST
ncbi:MAG: hypothetical protein QF775_03600 [archaeon]|jgi:hypothetical protein|nr:hypothetical protein [Euryarchaeota archaeon]MDP6704543.1 hypothetical protein [archaeon]|tara:strand:+ start:45607 stop:45840 length:234 start_codon:yes stop_codon:yes gene_type:complete